MLSAWRYASVSNGCQEGTWRDGVVPQKTLLSIPDVPKSQPLIPLKSQKTEGSETVKINRTEGQSTAGQLFSRTAYHGRDHDSTHTRKRGRGASSACGAGRETMGREEIHHLTPRVGVGLWVIAESHAQDGAIGQMHVERVRAARIDHEPEFGRGGGLRGVHLLAKVGGGDGVGTPNE